MADERAQNEMDIAAGLANEDWKKLPDDVRKQVEAWWRKWYMKAGHKRLGKVVLGKDW